MLKRQTSMQNGLMTEVDNLTRYILVTLPMSIIIKVLTLLV